MDEFDRYASDYTDLLDESVSASGYGWEYFADYKANYLAGLARLAPRKILDFGCGIGLLSRCLVKRFPSAALHGYDVSSASVEKAAEALSGAGSFTTDLDSLDDDYDLVVAANVLHHVPVQERRQTVVDLAKRLSADGLLALFEHNPVNPLTRRAVDRCAFDDDAVLLSMHEAAGYVRQAGLHVARRDYIVFMPKRLAPLRFVEPLLSWCPLGAQYVVVGGGTRVVGCGFLRGCEGRTCGRRWSHLCRDRSLSASITNRVLPTTTRRHILRGS